MTKNQKIDDILERFDRNQVHTSKSECPKCFHLLAAASCLQVKKRTPRKGDITICGYCQSVLEFDDSLGLKFATDSRLKAIAGDEEFKLLNTISSLARNHTKK